MDRRGRIGALLLAVAAVTTSCGASRPTGSSPVTTAGSSPVTTAGSSPVTTAGSSLAAPKSSPAQDAEYLSDLAQADSVLASYIQAQGNVALRALLTDGSAFCAFLQRGGGIDNAMTSLVIGANSDESQTHLPATVTTYNTIDAVALLKLCPAEQKLVPTADRSKIQQLAQTLGDQ
jgi:hypothetical protein